MCHLVIFCSWFQIRHPFLPLSPQFKSASMHKRQMSQFYNYVVSIYTHWTLFFNHILCNSHNISKDYAPRPSFRVGSLFLCYSWIMLGFCLKVLGPPEPCILIRFLAAHLPHANTLICLGLKSDNSSLFRIAFLNLK